MNKASINHWLQFLTVGIWRVTDDDGEELQPDTDGDYILVSKSLFFPFSNS